MKNLNKINIGGKPKYVKFAEDVDFFELFGIIEKAFDTCFIFESLGEEGKYARYSILGFDPEHVISARENVLNIDGEKYEVDNPNEELRKLMTDKVISRNYAGGLVGYLGYDAVNYVEPAVHVRTHNDFEQFLFGVYTDGLILDKLTGELIYFYFDRDRSDVIREIMSKHVARSALGVDGKLKVEFLGDSLGKDEHGKIVEKVKEQIKAGNIFQCEVGMKTKFRIDGDFLQIYEELRYVNPSPFMYYLKFGNKRIIGASPELAFSLRDGEMAVRPLAGTIRRGRDDSEDQLLARTLLNDLKEIAEHNMLVDLHRNDVGRVSKFGTVKIKDLMTVVKFSHVQHISSEITGLMANGEDMFSAFAANFPAGTLTGAPKIEAMKIIDANEPEGRGPYGGAVGHFGFNGDCTFAIAIRSLFAVGEMAYTQTSSGIVYDSDPGKEYDEVQRKLAAMKGVLGKFK